MTETKKHPIDLVAIDLDGTLLNSKHQMSERNEKALKAVLQYGIKVIFATGKAFPSSLKLSQRLGISHPGVFVQGTTIYSADGSLISHQTLDKRIVRQVITFAEDRGFCIVMYSGKRILARQPIDRLIALTESYDEPPLEYIGALQNVLDSTDINKVLIIKPHDAKAVTAMRWQLSMQLNDSVRLLQAGVSDMVEVLPAGSSKGNGLKMLLKDMGIKPERVLALGDAENDVEMLQMVGIGVAMGNASDHVKSIAKHVVASNDDNGVAEAMEKFILGEKVANEAEAKAKPAEEAPKHAEKAKKAEGESDKGEEKSA